MAKRGPRRSRSSSGSRPKDELPTAELISEEEWLAREHSYVQRLQDVKICIGFIHDSVEDYNELLRQQLKDEHWARFLACDGLPRPHWPDEIRRFVFQMRCEEAQAEQNLVNWTLSVNERSILTQDIFQKDRTRKKMEQELRPDIGKLYDVNIERILATIKRIDRVQRSELELAFLTPARLIELGKIQHELLAEIGSFLDKLTYRIITAPEAFMTNLGCHLASYCYESSNYNYQLWCLRDVPIRFQFLDLPLMSANLDCVGLNIQLPFSVLSDNMCVRCVHTHFDAYSERAKSFEIVIDSETMPHCGLLDIDDCIIDEWLTQVDIQEEIITKMESKMQQYVNVMDPIEANQTLRRSKTSEQKKEQTQAKAMKAPKEPQSLPEGMFPDPYNIFLESEHEEYIKFLDEAYNPANNPAIPGEINLRRFILIGGIFAVDFVRKPKHTAYEKLNITLHEDGRVLYVEQDKLVDEDCELGLLSSSSRRGTMREAPPRLSVAPSRHEMQRLSAAETTNDGTLLYLDRHELPYFFLTFKLPKHLCRWGQPKVCLFIEEEVEEPEEELIYEPESELRGKKKQKGNRQHQNLSMANGRATSVVQKFDKAGNPIETLPVAYRRPNPTCITRQHHESNNIYRPSHFEWLRRSAFEQRSSSIASLQIATDNFEMSGKSLNKLELHLIRQQCVPRIISSFKFPLEFKEERDTALEIKKAAGNKLLRRHIETDQLGALDEKQPYPLFNYEDQYGPERVYPHFDDPEPFCYEAPDRVTAEQIEDVGKSLKHFVTRQITALKEPSLYGVLATLDEIQGKYTSSFKRTIPEIKLTRRTHKERLSSRRSKSTMQNKQSLAYSQSFLKEDESETNDDEVSVIRKTETLRKSRKADSLVASKDISPAPKPPEPVARRKVLHWTTNHILHSKFDGTKRTITIKTDRLGVFCFAYNRYAHFPFRHWCLEPNEEKHDEVIFTLDTYYVRVVLHISNEGVRGYVIDLPKEYQARPEKFLNIEQPISDFVELRKRFQDMNINIFAEPDACFYIENGYFSQKHLAAEMHVYNAVSVHCKLMKFTRSDWNRLATRRDIVLGLRNPKDMAEGADITARVTPESATFVEIKELCSDDLNVFRLDYQQTWRNVGHYADLHQLINSMYPHATELRNRDAKLMYYIRKLMQEIRPLSFG
ncbi:uncharacterized protein LOC117580041 [Drosophila guanche]|uniref:Blast:Axonemal 84 kDa protein n=1 Tax=Drosophila guanche TaxID=7266 RepID=A0A3B0JA82_DROGU|nr:uncharacterized protein LOC117580041 [Drosophila guanche]SPP76892.1 blast:Axonemal 84 kDa protein [Drosophila guanche]